MPYLEPTTPGRSSCSSMSNGRTLIGDTDYFPCGPVNETTTAVPCCRRNDTCMEGGLCSSKNKDEDEDKDKDSDTTSYYASGCTDPSFANPACGRLCVNSIAGDVAYNGTEWCWQCCADSYDVDCAKPLSDETFVLPPPNALKAYFQIPATGLALISAPAPTGTPSSTGIPSSSSSPAAPAPSAGGDPLSHGAAAALGVGATASAVLIAGAVWLLARRARAKRARPAGSPDDGGGDEVADPFATPRAYHPELASPVAEKPRAEMTSHPYLAPELPGTLALYELSAAPPSRGASRPPSPLSPVKK